MTPLYILGTGLLAEEFFALVQTMDFDVQAFVENLDPAKIGTRLCDRPIIGVADLPDGAPSVCALSTTKRKLFIEQVAGRASFVTLVHPSSVILPGTTLGPGTIVSTGVLVASNTQIGAHVFLNRGVRVGHHTKIGGFVTLQPGVNLAGAGSIGDETYVGMGTLILERLTIGRGVTIAAGSVVRKDIPDFSLAAGSPASVVKRNVEPH